LTALWRHALALALVLLGTAMVVGQEASFSADEGAALLQAEQLADGRGWLTDHWMVDADPDGSQFYYHLSEGGPEEFAVFAKHPAWVLALSIPVGAAGAAGAVGISVVAAVLAACAAGVLAERMRAGLGPWALWIAGVASPLFVDAQLVMAHTLGAAAAGWLVVVVVGRRDRPLAWVVAGAVLLTAAAILSRTESLLFAAAVAAVVGLSGLRRRDWRDLVLAGVVGTTGIGVYLLERRWLASIVGGEATVSRAGVTTDGGWLQGRITGAGWSLVAPTGATFGPTVWVALAVFVTVVIGAVAARRGDRALVRIMLVAAAIGGVAAAAVPQPDAISGLLVASPVVTAGLLLLRRRQVEEHPAREVAGIALLFALAVLATQYGISGAAEWGGRFLALGLPLIASLAALGLAGAASHIHPRDRTLALVSLACLGLGFGVLGARALADAHHRTELAIAELDRALEGRSGPDLGDGDRRPIVVSTWPSLGRFTWPDPGRERGVIAFRGEFEADMATVRSLGAEEVLFVSSDGEADRALIEAMSLPAWRIVEELDGPSETVTVFVLRPA
jgi:hypothetical protein